ncbi:hypothetical protein [Marinobacter salarius]|jgi:hypothetical protein|uniref:Uncharacterized protein n=1 Tax=Marinobacter salarius TaxID=1420917 RepID=A0A1W6KEA0_9GAMM|nr:hypothetical protein [Marinobacter salarius]ARM85750.1 hypothetical protein MARSALSMR5_03730 [Marinobacter salarius]
MSKSKGRRRNRKKVVTPAETPELLRTIRDDLLFLRNLNFGRPSRTEVRLSSGVLRRLLHEGLLQAGWNICFESGSPTIPATDLEAMLARVPPKYIHYAYAGGAATEGAQHVGYFLLVIPKDEYDRNNPGEKAKEIQSLFDHGAKRDFSLPEFLNSACVISGAAGVSRLELVKFVANKLGGVHWDNHRGGWTGPVSSRHLLLDEGHLIVGRLPAPLYETLSIAEAIAEAPDIEALCKKIDEVAPEEEVASNVIKFREGRTGKYSDLTFNTQSGNP